MGVIIRLSIESILCNPKYLLFIFVLYLKPLVGLTDIIIFII